MQNFKLKSNFEPSGDQPSAIERLNTGLKKGLHYQTLLGATGTGKTFTIANLIEKVNKPTLVIAHNKTLAAQLAQEYRDFFPDNAVHYFVSYYDYYQPEAYMPITDTYIEKEAQINQEIERLRHAATQALLTRQDVIIVASVSCIYGLGSPQEYEKVNLKIESMKTKTMQKSENKTNMTRGDLMRALIKIYFERTSADLKTGQFRAIGNTVEIMPASEEVIYRVEFDGESIVEINKLNAITRSLRAELDTIFIFPARHYVTPERERDLALNNIATELKAQLDYFKKNGLILEHERLRRRTEYDIAMIKQVGYCSGIENYSRHFDRRQEGEPPYSLLDYFAFRGEAGKIDALDVNSALSEKRDFLTVIDESHVTVPQLRGMYAGDKARKNTLIEHGFRLPSARDNRPLTFEEFETRIGQSVFTSATPGPFELEKSRQIVEQIIRPTGLVDPQVEVRPITGSTTYEGQIKNFIKEAKIALKSGNRAMATTLTKKMAEDLSEYLKKQNIKSEYLHSDIKTIERIQILSDFRKGVFDILVGVNLLREGLDLPEIELIGIFDADKEGFLRSETSLIQIIGRAARNSLGRVILYGDNITGSMERAIKETERRREIQLKYNLEHNITPLTIKKQIHDITEQMESEHGRAVRALLEIDKKSGKNKRTLILEKKTQMKQAVEKLDFETAALLRDELVELDKSSQSRKKIKRVAIN